MTRLDEFLAGTARLAVLSILLSNPKGVERLLKAHADALEDVVLYATGSRWAVFRRRWRRRAQRLWRRLAWRW